MVQHGGEEAAKAFLSTRFDSDGRASHTNFGTLGSDVDCDSIVNRAMPY
jgi:hypothetical protein